MADRGQKVAAAWLPRAWLGLTMPRAGRLEVEDALLPSARALPLPTFPPLATAVAVGHHRRHWLRRAHACSPQHQSQRKLVPHRPFATSIASPRFYRHIVPKVACSPCSVSSHAARSLVGLAPPQPSPWPAHLRPPRFLLWGALESRWVGEPWVACDCAILVAVDASSSGRTTAPPWPPPPSWSPAIGQAK